MALSVDRAINQAGAHKRRGELQEAEQLYRSVLEKFPNNKRALQGLETLNLPPQPKRGGATAPDEDQFAQLMALYEQNRFHEALTLGEMLEKQYPRSSDLLNFLGAVNDTLRNLERAADYYRRAIKINPTFADAINNLGNTLSNLNRNDEAVDCYAKALRINPGDAQIHNNMGTTYHALERHGDAVESYKKALQINPGSPEVHNNLGVTLHALGRFDEAIECYRTAQQINSRHVEAHNNLGITLAELDRPNEAIDCYEAALRLYPGFADARNNLGRALASLGRHDEAIESYAIALEINPHEPKAPNNLGISLSALGQHAQAIDYYGRALEIDPTYVDAYNNLGNSLAEMDRCDEAIESYSKALAIDPDQGLVAAQRLHLMAHMCDWAALAHHRDAIPSLGVTGDVVSPFAMLSLEDNPERHFVRARRYAADRFGTIEQRPVAPPAEAKQHLRIGYFSADFHSHAVMHLMARLFALHDRNRFVVEAYSFGPDKRDDMRARLVDTFDEFYDVQQESNREVAALARRNGVDIAVDLNGYTEHARTGIFAHRAAPVQINYLGYPGTMGAPFMDYIVSDKTVIPETHRQHFSEKMIYLPHAFMVNDNTRAISDGPLTRAAFGLPETGFVFCCFNNNNKIFPEEFDLWMGLLKQIDGSVLWLRRANQWAVGNLRTEAQARGIDPDRLIFAEMLPFPEHLARHRLADLFLDTFNYNAHSTASEALWAGLPIVTRRGQGFPARVAASLLTAVEVPELITETANEYEALAVSLATDPDRLTGIKAKLQQNRETTSLFDTERFTRHLKAAFQQAYQRFSDGLPPDTIIVEGAA